MPLLEISVVPVGTSTPSFSSHVSSAVDLIQHQGLQYQVTPTATVVEGSLDQLMQLAKDIHQNALQHGANRVITHMSIDDRTDKPLVMSQQIDAVQQSLQ